MAHHAGGCHCGAVRFSIDTDIDALLECNCSICTKKGITHVPVPDSAFTLERGEEALSEYRFGSGEARHWFCSHCGIHPFGRPRTDPARYTVNARCLDDYDALAAALPLRHFDGRHHPKDER